MQQGSFEQLEQSLRQVTALEALHAFQSLLLPRPLFPVGELYKLVRDVVDRFFLQELKSYHQFERELIALTSALVRSGDQNHSICAAKLIGISADAALSFGKDVRPLLQVLRGGDQVSGLRKQMWLQAVAKFYNQSFNEIFYERDLQPILQMLKEVYPNLKILFLKAIRSLTYVLNRNSRKKLLQFWPALRAVLLDDNEHADLLLKEIIISFPDILLEDETGLQFILTQKKKPWTLLQAITYVERLAVRWVFKTIIWVCFKTPPTLSTNWEFPQSCDFDSGCEAIEQGKEVIAALVQQRQDQIEINLIEQLNPLIQSHQEIVNYIGFYLLSEFITALDSSADVLLPHLLQQLQSSSPLKSHSILICIERFQLIPDHILQHIFNLLQSQSARITVPCLNILSKNVQRFRQTGSLQVLIERVISLSKQTSCVAIKESCLLSIDSFLPCEQFQPFKSQVVFLLLKLIETQHCSKNMIMSAFSSLCILSYSISGETLLVFQESLNRLFLKIIEFTLSEPHNRLSFMCLDSLLGMQCLRGVMRESYLSRIVEMLEKGLLQEDQQDQDIIIEGFDDEDYDDQESQSFDDEELVLNHCLKAFLQLISNYEWQSSFSKLVSVALDNSTLSSEAASVLLAALKKLNPHSAGELAAALERAIVLEQWRFKTDKLQLLQWLNRLGQQKKFPTLQGPVMLKFLENLLLELRDIHLEDDYHNQDTLQMCKAMLQCISWVSRVPVYQQMCLNGQTSLLQVYLALENPILALYLGIDLIQIYPPDSIQSCISPLIQLFYRHSESHQSETAIAATWGIALITQRANTNMFLPHQQLLLDKVLSLLNPTRPIQKQAKDNLIGALGFLIERGEEKGLIKMWLQGLPVETDPELDAKMGGLCEMFRSKGWLEL